MRARRQTGLVLVVALQGGCAREARLVHAIAALVIVRGLLGPPPGRLGHAV